MRKSRSISHRKRGSANSKTFPSSRFVADRPHFESLVRLTAIYTQECPFWYLVFITEEENGHRRWNYPSSLGKVDKIYTFSKRPFQSADIIKIKGKIHRNEDYSVCLLVYQLVESRHTNEGGIRDVWMPSRALVIPKCNSNSFSIRNRSTNTLQIESYSSIY